MMKERIMLPNSDPFSDHVQLMKAVYQEYTLRDKNNDSQAVKLVKQVDSQLDEMNTLCKQREEAVKGIIKSRKAESTLAGTAWDFLCSPRPDMSCWHFMQACQPRCVLWSPAQFTLTQKGLMRGGWQGYRQMSGT
jgi:hypothetical protein